MSTVKLLESIFQKRFENIDSQSNKFPQERKLSFCLFWKLWFPKLKDSFLWTFLNITITFTHVESSISDDLNHHMEIWFCQIIYLFLLILGRTLNILSPLESSLILLPTASKTSMLFVFFNSPGLATKAYGLVVTGTINYITWQLRIYCFF